ncbi:VWA domain-containing protein [Alphaproteobacteria bacterium LSUCC0684]
MPTASPPAEPAPKLDQNIILFARLLRAVGMKPGPAATLDAIEAVQLVGVAKKSHLFHALSSCFVKRREDLHLFEQAFFLFWQNPRFQERLRNLLIPQIRSPFESDEAGDPMLRRLEEALGSPPAAPLEPDETEELEIDASGTASDTELFKAMDFRMMSAEEIDRAEAAIMKLRLDLPEKLARRHVPDTRGSRIGLQQSLRAARRHGGLVLPRTVRRQRQSRPLVALLDISGSMENYSRIFLHFLHTLTHQHRQVTSFLFGTRLTNITRQLRNRDVDDALKSVAGAADDWSGGTRIATSIAHFNKHWSRRVLGRGPIVLLITDGLDREHDPALAWEMERLHKSCHRLIWLNPLLRYEKFAPKSVSIRSMLGHVDAFRPIHSLASMEELVAGLAGMADSQDKDLAAWQKLARLAGNFAGAALDKSPETGR